MKKYYTYFVLATGMALFVSCGSEPRGESRQSSLPELDKIEQEDIQVPAPSMDSIVDTVEVVVVPPPLPEPPPEPGPPEPWPPSPGPDPIPYPEPIPFPEPPMPEPVPVEPEIIQFPDVYGKFPNGDTALFSFIKKTIVYPEIDLELGIQGKVYVSFVIERDGTITDIKILRGISKSLDREAKRVVRAMPKWTPAEARGVKVRSLMRLPMTFKID